MELVKSMFSLFYNIFDISKPLFCSHNWEYWHVKLRCDHHKGIDGNMLHNNIRKCSKCSKQQIYRLIPKDNRWVDNFSSLPKEKTVELWVNVLGKKNKHQIRGEKLSKLINKKESF